MPRILFVLLWRREPYPGTKTWHMAELKGPGDGPPLAHGLSNSAGFVVEMLQDAGVEAKLVHVHNDNEIYREIQLFSPTHVVIEAAWMRPKKLDDLAAVFPDLPIIVRGHSSTPFLAQDMQGFPWTLDYLANPNGIVAPNDARHQRELRVLLERAYPAWGRKTIERKLPFLPNYYPVHEERRPNKKLGGYIDVGCFGASRPMKNMVVQAIAALMFAQKLGRKLRFHINGDRIEGGGGPCIRALEAIFSVLPDDELVLHNWMRYAEFKDLISTMDLVTQASLAETFCIVAADAVSQGVPTAMSSEIPWAPHSSIAEPGDSEDIARVMNEVWRRRGDRCAAFHSLSAYTEETRRIWLRYFGI